MLDNSKAQIYIGTSGWNYKHWYGVFYPEELKQKNLLEYYSKFFKTVEINSSFYRLPSSQTFNSWRDKVPLEFAFSVKANRYITHLKRLIDVEEPLNNFIGNVKYLGEKLGIILFQLPPSLKYDLGRLESFFSILPKNFRYAVEFRSEKWFNDGIYDLLKRYQISFCIFHFYPIMAPDIITSDTVYLRFHGSIGPYKGKYDREFLKGVAEKIQRYHSEGKDIFCYFDNDEKGYAIMNAIELKKMLNTIN